jgi:hypothetical protein
MPLLCAPHFRIDLFKRFLDEFVNSDGLLTQVFQLTYVLHPWLLAALWRLLQLILHCIRNKLAEGYAVFGCLRLKTTLEIPDRIFRRA